MQVPALASQSADQPSVLSASAVCWRRRVFAATWLSYIGFYFCRRPFSVAKDQIGQSLDFTTSDLGTLYATYLIAYTLGQFGSGAIGPRFGPRKMLLAGMGVSLLTHVVLGTVASLGVFAVWMAINGLAQATGWSNNLATMAAWFDRGERGTVMGLWATNFQVGGVVATALAAWVLSGLDWRWTFWAGATAMGAILTFFVLNQRNRPQDVGLPRIASDAQETVTAPGQIDQTPVRWNRSTWITVFLVGGAYFGMKYIRYALWSWAPFVLKRNFGLQDDEAGYVSTLFDVCGVVGVMATGWMSDHWFGGRRALISFVMLLGLVGTTTLLLTWGQTATVPFAICIGLVGFTLYGPDALLTGAGAMDVGRGRGAVRAAGVISGLGSAGSVVQEIAIGRSYDATGGALGPILVMLLGSAGLAAACVAIILLRNRAGQSDV